MWVQLLLQSQQQMLLRAALGFSAHKLIALVCITCKAVSNPLLASDVSVSLPGVL